MNSKNYLFSLLLLLCVATAHGVELICNDVDVRISKQWEDGSAVHSIDKYAVYVKIKYTPGNIKDTLKLKMIRRRDKPLPDQVVTFAPHDFNIQVQNGVIQEIATKDNASLESWIDMTHGSGDKWNVDMHMTFSKSIIGNKSVSYGGYEGEMICKDAEES
ncbi:MAG: hypothetical protein K0R14_1471 [Burkholderiales bacterium]|jgi:hypothetical protein|nr:hypothetical protein [Burkholderiales bacterium]